MHYEISYDKALEKGQKENKPIIMMVEQSGCPYCNKFELKTLTKDEIQSKVIKDFIPLTILRDVDTFPKQFYTKGVPTVLFIESIEQKIFYKSFGYKSKNEYETELDTALSILKKGKKN